MPCKDAMAERCDDCTDENKCLIKCKPGFFIDPPSEADIGANCSSCGDFCIKCEKKNSCQQCSEGYLLFTNKCVRCEAGCLTCEEKPNNCISCAGGYLLDTEKECYYRYTLIIMIGAAIGIFVFFSLICKFLITTNKPERQSIKVVKNMGESIESILGDEFKRDPTIISDVTGIGKQYEVDQDLSVVEESKYVDSVHDDSIRLDEYNSRKNSQMSNHRNSLDNRKPKDSRNDHNQRATVPNNNFY
jgi:hypothetical protein